MSWLRRFRRGSEEPGATYLIVGLGNPGPEYAGTRHNAGFEVCNRLAHRRRDWRRTRHARTWQGEVAGVTVTLLKPRTYVNASGPAVARALSSAGLSADRLIVVQDDLDLAFARVRVRDGGSWGGHRGIESILHAVGGADFLRVKVGIGRPPPDMDPAHYVLERFSASEREAIDDAFTRAADAVRALLTRPAADVMQEVNQQHAAVRPRD
ncbi:MAG: aminoacyl-tRNA hydrolase [Chloroflexota bacterium]|nr:aminoacyl-tRNA hydrolase [Chloroflexota bacterium]